MTLALSEQITSRILLLRSQRVMIDADLAELYGVPTKALNQAIKRNIERFPHEFMFQLTPDEKQEVVTNCDHLKNLKFSKSLPFAFTDLIKPLRQLMSPPEIKKVPLDLFIPKKIKSKNFI